MFQFEQCFSSHGKNAAVLNSANVQLSLVDRCLPLN